MRKFVLKKVQLITAFIILKSLTTAVRFNSYCMLETSKKLEHVWSMNIIEFNSKLISIKLCLSYGYTGNSGTWYCFLIKILKISYYVVTMSIKKTV